MLANVLLVFVSMKAMKEFASNCINRLKKNQNQSLASSPVFRDSIVKQMQAIAVSANILSACLPVFFSLSLSLSLPVCLAG